MVNFTASVAVGNFYSRFVAVSVVEIFSVLSFILYCHGGSKIVLLRV